MTTRQDLKKQGFEQFSATKYEDITFNHSMKLLRQYKEFTNSKDIIRGILHSCVPLRLRKQVVIQCKLEGLT